MNGTLIKSYKHYWTIKNKEKYISPYKLWDSSLQNNLASIEIDYEDILNSEEGLIKWLELLHHTGIAIVKAIKAGKR